mmetsp:Transcript_23207/g.22736  ORF Transcript_23207/g.22736 Transcript_23207/m.22736 type:complete len:107 (+) Transcript_23207:370-690(+)
MIKDFYKLNEEDQGRVIQQVGYILSRMEHDPTYPSYPNLPKDLRLLLIGEEQIFEDVGWGSKDQQFIDSFIDDLLKEQIQHQYNHRENKGRSRENQKLMAKQRCRT